LSAADDSVWAPFRGRVFRAIWIAQFVGNIGTWAQTVGAQWLMGDLRGGAFEVSLVQTAMTLPVFLLVLPAGSLGDIFDRRRLLIVSQTIMLAGAGALAILTFAHATTPALLLLLTATIGAGNALSAPSFAAVQPELVPRDEVPRAALLNGASVNLARAVGPAIAGLLIGSVGPAGTFTLNAVSFAGVIAALARWRRPRDHRPLGAEHVRDAIVAGIRYTRNAPHFATVLARSFLFILPASALWTLLAVLARGPLKLGATGYGVLLGSVGIGAVTGTIVVIPRLRRRLNTSDLVTLGSVGYGAGLIALAVTHFVPLVIAECAVTGMAWIAVTSSVNAHAQLLLPNWTRARALAFMNLTFQGGQAIGSVLLGLLAGALSVEAAFGIAGALEVTGAIAGAVWLALAPLGHVESARYWPEPNLVIDVEPDSGPVLVTVEWRIDPSHSEEFAEAMRPLRRARRRTGATRWGLYRDTADPALFLETFTVDTWSEHMRQHIERGTVDDEALEARARRFLDGERTPRVRHLLWAYSASSAAPSPAGRGERP
jgi:MFS family permease